MAKYVSIHWYNRTMYNLLLLCNHTNLLKGDNMDITGMLAVGNGEPCPLCLKESDRKATDVFISELDNDLIGHMLEEHPRELDNQLFGGNDEEPIK